MKLLMCFRTRGVRSLGAFQNTASCSLPWGWHSSTSCCARCATLQSRRVHHALDQSAPEGGAWVAP